MRSQVDRPCNLSCNRPTANLKHGKDGTFGSVMIIDQTVRLPWRLLYGRPRRHSSMRTTLFITRSWPTYEPLLEILDLADACVHVVTCVTSRRRLILPLTAVDTQFPLVQSVQLQPWKICIIRVLGSSIHNPLGSRKAPKPLPGVLRADSFLRGASRCSTWH
jgi:hypothetical protein